MNLKRIEKELKKRLTIPYQWGKKQDNSWDKITNFIYKTFSFEELISKIQTEFGEQKNTKDLANYTLNRWYNFQSARAVEYIFEQSDKVQKVYNAKDNQKDFYLNSIPFDHKTSIFPKYYPESLAYAYKNPSNLIQWLYQNQSSEQRQHFENRIFLILYDKKGEHWKLKAEISFLQQKVENYLKYFDKNKLLEIQLEKKIVYTDLIWILR